MKTLNIGLDGATWKVLDKLIDNDLVPTIEKLIQNGTRATLKSTIPPVSIPAWPSLITGKNPGKLGIFGFQRFDRENFQSVPVHPTRLPNDYKVWDILSSHGKEACIVNVPFSISHQINGVLVPHSPLFKKDFMYPRTLKKKLREIDYEFKEPSLQSIDEDVFFEQILNTVKKRTQLLKYLIRNRDWDFFFAVYTTPDRIQHYFWYELDTRHPFYKKEGEPKICKFWKYIDKQISELIELTEKDTNILLFSDHGFGPHRKVFYVNDWLRHNNLLKTCPNPKEQLVQKLVDKVLNGLEFFERYINKKKIYRRIDILRNHLLRNFFRFEAVDPSTTKAFSPQQAYGFQQIYINLEHFDNKKEKRRFRREIINKMDQYFKKKSVPIEFYLPEQIYGEDFKGDPPDIIYRIDSDNWLTYSYTGRNKLIQHIPIRFSQTGTHRQNGIFIASGPDIKSHSQIKKIQIYDIFPTLLHIYRVPLPRSTDGKVLEDIFKEESPLHSLPVEYEGKSEKERIRRIIKQLSIKKNLEK